MKIGLEIHQRLATNKLFCSCPSLLSEDKDFEIKRELHLIKSEMKEIDSAAKKEEEKKRTFVYEVDKKTSCLVEMDEEPPHKPNEDALAIALYVAKELHANVVDKIIFMRKIVVDGSNTSGFQRTALIALNGYIETSKGRVGIETIALEEESAGIIEEKGNIKRYRLDRLGIPLIEITTAPDIKDAEHCVEVAKKIGMILRNTGKVLRGIGTIRQDLNISFDGPRYEIKGVQNLDLIKDIIKKEEIREKSLTEIFNTKRGPIEEIKELKEFNKSLESKIIQKGLKKGIYGMCLKNFKGLLGKDIGGKRFGKELSERAGVYGLGILHSEEPLEKYKIDKEEIMNMLNCSENDAFVITVGEKDRAIKALEAVKEFALKKELEGETRKANQDGTTSYMRPISGRARLYPETDVEPIDPKEIKMLNIKSYEERKKELEQYYGKDKIERVMKSKYLNIFDKYKEHAKYIFTLLERDIIELRRDGYEISEDKIIEAIESYLKGMFVKQATIEVLKGLSKGKEIEQILEEKGLKRIKGEELKKIVSKYKNIGELMRDYRLRIEAEEAIKYFKEKRI